MGEVVNLRRARKARARAEEKARAAENRARHGRTRGEKAVAAAESEQERRHLEGHRRTRAGEDGAVEPERPGGTERPGD